MEIARQYIADAGVDVILGGGVYKADPTPDYCSVYPESYNQTDQRQYIIDLAKDNDYAYVDDKDALNAAVADDKLKVLACSNRPVSGRAKLRKCSGSILLNLIPKVSLRCPR
ncbi:hypothetical protein [Desulfosarcina cetonica]|uniref:hypothetical protein n=1 Tax=Desulfosarcina cetonica TaxID=90730 RepID=UPI0012ED1FA4